MSAAQFAALPAVTPIVLDLNGNGISTTAAVNGVQFDIDASGKKTQVGWVGGGDGLLVRDINGDGINNGGRELFGGATQLANGQRAGDGLRAMADLDSSHDGKTNASGLKRLADFGVIELNLDFAKGTQLNNGNLLGLVGSYGAADGGQYAMADVWFAKAGADTPSLGDLLAGPRADLLGGVGAARAASAAPAV